VAGLLAERGRPAEALQHCSQALARDPGNAEALALLQRITATMAQPAAPQPEPQRVQGFDWAKAEEEVADITEPVPAQDDAASPVVEDIEKPAVRLADVGGMQHVKERLELAFLGPMRNPQLAKAFGKSLSGGPWFATARNVVAFANTDGGYDDLSAYLRKNKKL
jgi:hypothetical protein